ncbi:MAG: calcium/sodium antiporter [Balneolaceae bacterium]
MVILLFVAGLATLMIGAELLIRGSTRLATVFGISPLIIGLTVVAFATSSPELAVGIRSALAGQAGITAGNVIGSNIFNILFIIGISALITPLVISKQLLRMDIPLMTALSAVVLILSQDETFSRADAFLMATVLVMYVWFLANRSRRESTGTRQEYAGEPGSGSYPRRTLLNSVLVLGGLLLLVLGSHWLVDSALSIARFLGVSESVVGLTIVAAGTSLPEVVTSISAAFRGERDIAVGNVVGSNIFNLTGVLGISGIIAPLDISPGIIGFDLPVMIAAAAVCLPVCFTGGIISRKEGILLLVYYAVYTLYLILADSHHDSLPVFSSIMLVFVIPLTTVILTKTVLREIQNRKKSS